MSSCFYTFCVCIYVILLYILNKIEILFLKGKYSIFLLFTMCTKVYPYPATKAHVKSERERELFSFLRNAHRYINREEVCIVVKNRDKDSELQLINPNMLLWKKFMMPLFINWLIENNHDIKDQFGNWVCDRENINARWCELNICSRFCLVDFMSRANDSKQSYWSKTQNYNYVIIIDP